METVIELNGGILRAVPAIHYQAVFAEAVNSSCNHEDTKPDAIAVELGPHMVKAIAGWMRELGMGKGKGIILPCMLGILVKNRLIHPDFRDTAFFLQDHFGKPLQEISADLKLNMLNYSERYLISLSSTDSIIEAIRCAIELDIPVFGVDLDEFSIGNDGSTLIREPSTSSFDLEKYIGINAVNAGKVRDNYVDHRRELVMASRLKKILSDYGNVLYTCGLAHWDSIRSLMTDPSVKPAEFLISGQSPEMTRVIIHPNISVRFMDAYPVISTYYEENRDKQKNAEMNIRQLPDYHNVYREILARTYENYFSETAPEIPGARGGTQHLPDLENLLAHIRLMLRKNIPPMGALFETSVSIMPPAFNRVLASCLMDIRRDWASPEQFPDLPVLCPAAKSEADFCQLVEPGPGHSNAGKIKGERSTPFSVRYEGRNEAPGQLSKFWIWSDEPAHPPASSYCASWAWPPSEALLYGTANDAAKVAVSRSNEPSPAAFEGTLYQGIDIKATMRSIIQGEERIYIRKPSSSKKVFVPDGKSPDPTVFIFCSSDEGIGSHFSTLIAGSNVGEHVKDRKKFETIRHTKGTTFIASISYCHYLDVPATLSPHVESIRMLEGITIFGNPCINAKQGAQWIEENDYRCCPVLRGGSGITALISHYTKTYGVEITSDDWHNALIQFAIPYARERVVIIAPEKFRVPGALIREAKRKNIDLAHVPLNYFPADRIKEMRKRFFVCSRDPDGLTFPAEAEQLLGQKPDKYRDLLPVYMQDQLKKH
jgi:hypothetical protein